MVANDENDSEPGNETNETNGTRRDGKRRLNVASVKLTFRGLSSFFFLEKKMSNKKNQLFISEKKLCLFITSLLLFYAFRAALYSMFEKENVSYFFPVLSININCFEHKIKSLYS